MAHDHLPNWTATDEHHLQCTDRSLHHRRQDPTVPPEVRPRELHPPLPLCRQRARAGPLALRLCHRCSRFHNWNIHNGYRWLVFAPNHHACRKSWHQAALWKIPIQGPALGAELRDLGPGTERGRRFHNHRCTEERHRQAATGSH